MTLYTVHFRTDAQFATHEIEADGPEAALKQAREMLADGGDELWFEDYESGFPVNEIVVCKNDYDDEALALWLDEDMHLRLAARDLLDAAREVVARWEHGDLAEAVRQLAAAIAKAEGDAASAPASSAVVS